MENLNKLKYDIYIIYCTLCIGKFSELLAFKKCFIISPHPFPFGGNYIGSSMLLLIFTKLEFDDKFALSLLWYLYMFWVTGSVILRVKWGLFWMENYINNINIYMYIIYINWIIIDDYGEFLMLYIFVCVKYRW
jgi:hypothetical protein